MATKEKYQELADNIVELMGGESNISFFTHCITRLRFNVKDKSLVKTSEIDKLPGVVGAQWSGDQFQVIIGQAVDDAYRLICEKSGLSAQEAGDKDRDEAPAGKKGFSAAAVLDAITGSIAPVLPVLIAAGFLKVVILLLQQLGIMAATSQTSQVLTFVADAGFYFLPVFVGACAAKKFGVTMSLGMLVGAMLIHPSFISMVSSGDSLSVFGLPIYGASYASSVFPSILAVAAMAPIERFFNKHTPEAIRTLAAPFLTLLVMIPLTLCLLAPLGSIISTYLAAAMMWLYSVAGPLAIALISGTFPLLVIVGMHTGFIPIMINQMATFGYDNLMLPGGIIVNISQGVACLAVAIKTKDTDLRSTAISSAITSIVGGVSEPALFGVNLRLKTPLYSVMIGSFVGAFIAGVAGVKAFVMSGSQGLFALPIFLSSDIMNLVWEIVSILVGAAVTFVVTLILYKPEAQVED